MDQPRLRIEFLNGDILLTSGKIRDVMSGGAMIFNSLVLLDGRAFFDVRRVWQGRLL